MKKYNLETINNYINGEDIIDYFLEELEANTNFMIDVINVSNDKSFYYFAEDNVKKDYKFIRFIINKFKDNEKLISLAANTYIENQNNESDYIELLITMVNLIKNKNSDNYKKYKLLLETSFKSKRLKIELAKLKVDEELSDKIGMGFLTIYDDFINRPIILDYYATKIIEDIFEEYDINLEKYLHKRFKSFEKIEQIGIKKYILEFISLYDEMLSSYISSHVYLLDDIIKQIATIKQNWNNYIEINERKKYNEILDKVHEYMEYESVDYYSLGETHLLYLVAANLGIADTLQKYDSLSSEDYQSIMEEIKYTLNISKLSFNDQIDYNNIKKIIINILNDETADSGLSPTKENKNKKCKILKLPSVKPRD